MESLQKKINGYINTGIGYSLLTIVFGIILLVFPGVSLDILRWIISLALIAGGLALLINDFRRQTVGSFFSGSILGIFLLILGIIVVVHPDILGIIPIALGAYMIISSFLSIRITESLREVSPSSFYISLITSVISVLCGIVLIVNPFGGAIAMTILLGAVAIVYGIFELVDLIVLRRNINEVAKYIKDKLSIFKGKDTKEVKEAKVVKESKKDK